MGNSKQKTDAGLRIESVRRGKKIPLTVDGTPIIAHEGESVHAALAASGIQILGTTRKARQNRGILCGMGICYQCRVEINGIPDQRACMTPVKAHMEIVTRPSCKIPPDMVPAPGTHPVRHQGEGQK